MSNNTLPRPARRLLWSANVRQTWRMRRTRARAAWLCCALMLLLLVMSAMGCAHNPTPPCLPPAPVTLPALSESLPSVSYSIGVQQRIKSWGLLLTATPPTLKP